MFEFLWFILGYTEKKEIMCVNSFHPTDRKFNYVITKFPTDDDEEDDDIEEDDIDEYFKKYY